MAHNLHQENGRASMMYVGERPWHGLGTELDHPATAEEAIKAANLDWQVRKIQLYAFADGISRAAEGEFAIVPSDRWKKDKDCAIFGTVGSGYTPRQNREAFQFFDPIVGEGAAVYHTAGALGGGERIWLLAKLPGEIRVADGDISEKYLLLSNSHDGKSSVQIKFTPVRVVCQNTLIQALRGSDQTLRVAHRRGLKPGLEIARRNLGLINTRYSEIENAFKRMVEVEMDDARLTEYLRLVFPDPTDPEDERAAERAWKQRRQATRLFENGAGNRLKAVAGTLWAAYNGVTEMVDHGEARRDGGKRLNYIWFGGGAGVKVRAFKVATERMETEWSVA